MNRNNHASVVRLTSLALLAALVVVLQTVASGIRIGPVPISLTLVPIVVGAILFGPGAGAGLGAVFGVVCLIAGITGMNLQTSCGSQARSGSSSCASARPFCAGFAQDLPQRLCGRGRHSAAFSPR